MLLGGPWILTTDLIEQILGQHVVESHVLAVVTGVFREDLLHQDGCLTKLWLCGWLWLARHLRL